MAVRRIFNRTIVLALASVALCGAGCRLSHNAPPTRVGELGPELRDQSGRRSIVLGTFQNPDHSPLGWKDIGPGMTRTLERTLLNHGEFDVTVDPGLARSVAQIASMAPDERERRLEQLRRQNPGVRYVLVGKVTDFTHSRDMPDSVRRKIAFIKLNDAVVALRVHVIDLQAGREVASDHIYARVDAGRGKTEKTYADLSFDSYLFWTTPLGEASEVAAEETILVLNRLVPTSDDSRRIVEMLSGRRVRVAGGSDAAWAKGERWYVQAIDPQSGKPYPVMDPSGFPIEVRILADSRINSIALLYGQPPDDLDLRGAVLQSERPRAASGGASRAAVEDGDDDVR